ncbi:hypothetical protein BD413DRAFT_616067 [Trametes elegans]|nr:hypothetical protein BD413DRAFT_616067 [Trametes elegans]
MESHTPRRSARLNKNAAANSVQVASPGRALTKNNHVRWAAGTAAPASNRSTRAGNEKYKRPVNNVYVLVPARVRVPAPTSDRDRERSASVASSQNGVVDGDGDSQMGDEDEEQDSQMGEGDDDEEEGGDEDSQMGEGEHEPQVKEDEDEGEDEVRLCTPHRDLPYNPGSVVLTPRKDRGLRREPRIGGGFDFWQEQDGVGHRLTFLPDRASPAPGQQQQQQQQQPLGKDAQHIREALDAERARHGGGLRRYDSIDTIIAEEERNDEDAEDDAEDDALSVASDATVRVDPRATPQPTVFNGARPIVRQPTLPADYEWNAPGPSRPRAGRLSTIEEGGSDLPQWPSRFPEQPCMRILRDSDGRWVREGSLPPDLYNSIDRSELPPRIDLQEPAAPRAPMAASLVRTDTEPVL